MARRHERRRTVAATAASVRACEFLGLNAAVGGSSKVCRRRRRKPGPTVGMQAAATGLFLVMTVAFGYPAENAYAQAVAEQSALNKIQQGVYTTAQGERGRATFVRVCALCHNFDMSGNKGPALKGEPFMKNWEAESVNRLFAKIRDTMPPSGTVETLSDDAKLDVVAYILQANDFPAGSTELSKDVEALEAIEIVRKGGQGPREASNFALVQVVGCLAHDPKNGWVLASTSEPVLTRDEAPTAALLTDASVKPLGRQTYVLQSAIPFHPDAHVGQKMEARGLLYRAPDENSLTLTSLLMVGSSCAN